MNENGVEKNLKCSKCGIILLPTDKYCGNCGNPVSLNDKVNDTLKCSRCGSPLHSTDRYCNNCGNPTALKGIAPEKLIFVNPKYFDPIFENGEEVLLEEVIKREISKLKIDINTKLLPLDILKRKRILNIIFSVLVFIYISMIFFHFPIVTYIIGLVILIIFKVVTQKYNLIKYLKKEIKSRPSEKISNIVMNVKTSFVPDNTKALRIISLIIAIVLPLIIFINPLIMYEKLDEGYGVRFYTFGLTNFTTAKIPDTYKGEKVVSLRGNTFSNMFFLKSVTLPNSITEIRGQAFKNNMSLVNVNIPSNLKYLGGGAFYNCYSLKEVSLPDTLTYLGGEAFYNASSLTKVKLSKNLIEIRGNSFENCSALEEIEIPSKVTRIGAHAFYGNTNLKKVILSKDSALAEIGSSAFRECYSLRTITVPRDAYINERAFKDSPTYVYYFD